MEAMNSGDRYKRFFRGDVAEFRWYADLLSDADVETIQSELAGSYIPSTCAETCDEKRARFEFNVLIYLNGVLYILWRIAPGLCFEISTFFDFLSNGV